MTDLAIESASNPAAAIRARRISSRGLLALCSASSASTRR
jgi:hypothetical protein